MKEQHREEIIELLEYYEPLSLRETGKMYNVSNVTVLNIKKKYCDEKYVKYKIEDSDS